jgi:hypothetical protein
MRTESRWNSPLIPLLVALPVATLFIVLRWLDAAHRQLGKFVVAGSGFASQARVPKSLPVGWGPGYDGQFYYRLALDPFDLGHSAFGISLDSFSRVERMGYPFLAWLVAGGQHGSVPLALVIVNVAACGIVALAGGLLAKSANRHALWGLVFAGYWGYLWTLGRDLTELTAAAFVLLGLAARVRRAPIWSGLALLCAVASKETSVLLVGTLAVATLWVRLTQPRSPPAIGDTTSSPLNVLGRVIPRRHDLAFIIPLVGFVVWQLVLLLATGKLPIYKSGGENLGIPLIGLFRGFGHYVSIFPSAASALWFGELGILTVVAVGAAMSFRAAPMELRLLWVASVLLALSAATGIWLGDVGFRSLDDIYLMSWIVLLHRRQPIWPWAVICGVTWLVVFVELVRYI